MRSTALVGLVVVTALALLPAMAAAADPEPVSTAGAPITVVIPGPTPTPTATGGGSGGSGGGGGNGGQGGDTGGSTGSGAGAKNPDGSPVPPSNPGTDKPKLTLDHSSIVAHEYLTASGTGFAPGEKVQLVLYPGAIVIGSKQADANGAISMRFRVPKESPIGSHVAEATGWDSGYVANGDFTVTSVTLDAGIPWPWWLLLAALAAAVVSSPFVLRLATPRWRGLSPAGSSS